MAIIANLRRDVQPHQVGMYSPIPYGTELDRLNDAIKRYTRNRETCLRLAEISRNDAQAALDTAERWESQARDESELIHKAFTRKWAIEGAQA